ncbi:MAG: lipopolysaccharide heptosyltransferase II [Candidatus Omnitrophica bacterium]|nr:lipopolysaccharide heptosyltransferase II [Candidatus Omnitrophota bacterium]
MRILIARTDRIGDVMLSTPVITAVRAHYPDSYIAFCAGPAAGPLLETNPSLDEVIVFDKRGRHRGAAGMMMFVRELRRRKFDLAIVLHPTERIHLACFLAGIRKRCGYRLKWPFLLTHTIPHTKHQGLRHEVEYNLDLVRSLGLQPGDKRLFVRVSKTAAEVAQAFFSEHGIPEGGTVVCIHAGASCPSKRWPASSFAAVIDRLSKKGVHVVLVGGQDDRRYSDLVVKQAAVTIADLTGRTSTGELAAVLSKSNLLISNDSGPVHVAVALEVPVVAIFGRSDPGLSPVRWGPRGLRDVVLHKNVGCVTCLAHRCDKGFKCLTAITVDEVVSAAERLLA